jgi:hypothetical protein
MVTVSGAVSVDNVQVGSVNGALEDENLSGPRLAKTKEFYVEVFVDNVKVGDGEIVYDDTVSNGAGGQVTINVTGTVNIGGIQVGSASGSLTDSYGSETGVSLMTKYRARIVERIGNQFTVDVELTNTSSVDRTVTVELVDHNSNIVDSKQVIVPANSSTVVNLVGVTPNTPGTYNWMVRVA